MTNHKVLRTTSALVLTLAAMAFISMLAAGCNTTQPANRQVSDLQITTQVKSKLASDVGASTLTNINVNTTNGVVTLAGQVATPDTKQKAETVTAAVPGVVQVNNNLQVETPATSAAR
jgi:hyperosmotically inducible periplasmic protein